MDLNYLPQRIIHIIYIIYIIHIIQIYISRIRTSKYILLICYTGDALFEPDTGAETIHWFNSLFQVSPSEQQP